MTIEHMAENIPGATEATSSTTLSATPTRELPIYRAANFDPSRKDYQAKAIGKDVIYIDPLTGTEVARMPTVEGGAGQPLSIEELLKETEKDESKPQYWMDILRDLHNLPAQEREIRKDEYDQVCKRLAEFAHDKKLYGNSPEVTILEKQLTDFEEKEIKLGNRSEAEQQILQDLLDNLESQQNELIRVDNALGLRGKAPDFFSKAQWQELKDRKGQLFTKPGVGIDQLRIAISNITSAGFLSQRDDLKLNIVKAIKQVKKVADEDKQTKLNELLGEPNKLEKEQEAELLEDLKPDFLMEDSDRARDTLSWHFHEARKRGVFIDLEDRLDGKYQEWANALIPHREVSPFDRYGERSGRITRKTFSEIQDEIIEYFDNLLDPTKPQYVEHDARWNFLQRRGSTRGLTPQKRQELQGIRAELVRRAQIQIEDSLANFDEQLQGQAGLTHIDRISGEWNVHKLERDIRSSRERQEIHERSRPLFIQESYYRIVLTGRNRAQVEQGADQAAESIIQSATTFSLEVVRQRMEQLMTGIKEAQSVLQANETDRRISDKEAEDMVKEIQHKYTNKLDFFILDWLSANLMMDQFASYYSDRMRMAGDEKLKLIPAGHDGLDGLAIHWLTSPEFILYHRPQGFKGQLYDDDQTHKFMRGKEVKGLMKEQIVQRLMEYELKKGETRQEEANIRQKLKDGPTLDEFLMQFNRKGVIPPGIIPEDIIPADAAGKKDPTQFFNDLSLEQKVALLSWLGQRSDQLQLKSEERLEQRLFNSLRADQQVDIRREEYNQILGQLEDKKKNKQPITFEDLALVRAARQMLAQAQQNLQQIRAKAESAFDTADKVLTIFGEATFLSAPSIVMENGPEIRIKKGGVERMLKRGDYISVDDATLIYKYAILNSELTTITVGGKQYKVMLTNPHDNLALIRDRAQEWIKKCARAGYDRSKTSREFVTEITLPDGAKSKVTVKLAQGFEETGLTEAQFQAIRNAVKKLRGSGYQAEINGKKFEEIIQMDELQPIFNNFLVDYKSSMSEINDPNVIKEANRGRFVFIEGIRKRLGFPKRDRLEGTTQSEIDEYGQRVEDSRSFHAEVERLALFEATHDLDNPLKGPDDQPIIERGKYLYPFSPDRIDFGYERSWGVKRLHRLREWWYSRLQRTVPRGADLIHIPTTLTSLSREYSFKNFLQTCWAVGKMESIDNPSLVMMGERHKALVYLRSRGEGGLGESGGRLDKDWGWFEKWLVDANAFWKELQGAGVAIERLRSRLQGVADEKTNRDPIGSDEAELYVDALMKALGRFQPMLAGTEKLVGEERQALSVGSGYEENQKLILRFTEWMLSEKGGSGREQGGLVVQKEIADIIRLFTMPGTFTPGRVYRGKPEGNRNVILEKSPSIWEEAMRKLTPSHNPRLPTRLLSPSCKLVLVT